MPTAYRRDTKRDPLDAGRRTAQGSPTGTSARASPGPVVVVPGAVRAKWYGCLALMGTGLSTGGAPAWILVGLVLAGIAIPLALAATNGAAGLRELFLISRAPQTRRPDTEPKELT